MKGFLKELLKGVLWLVVVFVLISGLTFTAHSIFEDVKWPDSMLEQQPEEPQLFTPITYHVIECNVAGTDQIDYVIEISTRDPEEVGRIIRLLEGGE